MANKGISICVSDADVLVKLSRCGWLGLLGELFERVLVPLTVVEEVKDHVGTHGRGPQLWDACEAGWLEIVDVCSVGRLDKAQCQSIATFVASYEVYMDPGELEAAALANELGIPIILSDDRNAKNRIHEYTEILGLGHQELIIMGYRRKILTLDEAKSIYESIQSQATPNRKSKKSFDEAMSDAAAALRRIAVRVSGN